MVRVRSRKLRTNTPHLRNRKQDDSMFSNGHDERRNGKGRRKGVKNRFTRNMKDNLEQSLQNLGDWVAWRASQIRDPKLRRSMLMKYGMGGQVAGFTRLASVEPGAFLAILSKMLPLQITGKLDIDNTHKFETPEEVLQAIRDRGLPPPPALIDVTPSRNREVADER